MFLLLLHLVLNSVAVLAKAPSLRIVGGHTVEMSERPFQVLIFRTTPSFQPGCGGSIINSRWILTAAHCVQELDAEEMSIRAGSEKINGGKEAQWYNVVKSIPHPEFDDVAWAMTNDIALLKTDKTIKFGPNVQPIKLRKNPPRESMEAEVSGFGKTSQNNPMMSQVMKEVTVTVLNTKQCVYLLARVTDSLGLSDTHFCAAHLEGGRDACQGDSGGPITIGNALAGVVSWGIGCAQRKVPAFYTDVSKFIPWISRTLKKNSRSLTAHRVGGSKKG